MQACSEWLRSVASFASNSPSHNSEVQVLPHFGPVAPILQWGGSDGNRNDATFKTGSSPDTGSEMRPSALLGQLF